MLKVESTKRLSFLFIKKDFLHLLRTYFIINLAACVSQTCNIIVRLFLLMNGSWYSQRNKDIKHSFFLFDLLHYKIFRINQMCFFSLPVQRQIKKTKGGWQGKVRIDFSTCTSFCKFNFIKYWTNCEKLFADFWAYLNFRVFKEFFFNLISVLKKKLLWKNWITGFKKSKKFSSNG